MDPDYLPFLRQSTKPTFRAPPGAVDSHCHVFGPAAKLSLRAGAQIHAMRRAKEKLFALRDFLGLSRNVIVQGSCHGTDNRAMVDALSTSHGNARGVAVVRSDIEIAELRELHAAGVRGVRFNFVRRLVDVPTARTAFAGCGARGRTRLAHRRLFRGQGSRRAHALLSVAADTTVVVDHMGRPDVTKRR
jgi:2-pyrone-4,6-dicarboxylate lactonase